MTAMKGAALFGVSPAEDIDSSKSDLVSSVRKIATAAPVAAFVLVLFGTLFATVFALRVVGRVNKEVFLWPVTAVAMALSLPLWNRGWKERVLLLSAATIGFLAGAGIVGMPWWLAGQVALIMCFDLIFAGLLLGPGIRFFDDLKQQANMFRFLATVVAIPLVTGVLGGSAVSHFLNRPLLQTMISSAFAQSLGLAIVLPATLLLRSGQYLSFRKLRPALLKRASFFEILFVLATSLVFWQTKGPFLFMVFPPLMGVVLTAGLEGAVFSAVVLSVIGWYGTSHGYGPIWLMKGTALEHLMALQSFVLVSIVTALPVGALLDERRRAESRTIKALQDKSEIALRLEASEHLFQSFIEHNPNVTYIKDAEGRYKFYNQKFAELFSIDETAWLGRCDHEVFPKAAADAFRIVDLKVMETRETVELIEHAKDFEGNERSFKSIKFAYQDLDGQMMLAGISVDMTQEAAREAALHEALREKTELSQQIETSRHLLENFLHYTPNLTYVKDDQGKFVFYNREVEKFFGISSTEWLGRTISEVRPPAEAARYVAQDRQLLADGHNIEVIDEIPDQNGMIHKFKSVKFSYKNIDGRTMLAKISQDITDQLTREDELAAANRQLEVLAMTDTLTGVSNRRAFESRAEIEFALVARKHLPLSILVLDIDNFKQRNDAFGHAVGDEALKALAHVLKNCIRGKDLAARLGGEEFGLLLPETDTDAAMRVAERVQAALRAAPHGPVVLTVSIGVATTADKRVSSWERLLSEADDAMYVAKRTGKNRTIHRQHLPAQFMKPGDGATAIV